VLAPSGLFAVVILGGGSSIDQFLLTGLGLVLVAVKFPQGIAGSWQMLRTRMADAASGDPPGPPVPVADPGGLVTADVPQSTITVDSPSVSSSDLPRHRAPESSDDTQWRP
jgi:branched-chain amino acid transport system permease protein